MLNSSQYLRRAACASLTVTCAILSAPAVGLGDPLAEYYELENALMEAHDAFLEQAHEGNHEGDSAPTAKRPKMPDPRLPILKKIDKLADASLGRDHGAAIAAGAFMWSWNLDLDLEKLVTRFGRMVEHYVNDPAMDEVLPAVAEAGMVVGKADEWVGPLDRVARKAKESDTRLAALFAVGQIQLAARKLDKARTAFASVAKAGGDSDYAELAKGFLYEIEHLQIGMVAPDFTATRLDGKKVSLKSLRGKAVLLNFWATW